MKEELTTTSPKTNKQQSNSELIKRTNIENSPFEVISFTEKNEHFGAMGEYRLTEIYDTMEKAKEKVEQVTWNRVIQVIMLLIEKNKA